MEDVKTGIVSHLSERGFGFIKDPNNLTDRAGIFFHAKSLKGVDFADLEKGMKVEYTNLVVDERGTSARKVTLAE